MLISNENEKKPHDTQKEKGNTLVLGGVGAAVVTWTFATAAGQAYGRFENKAEMMRLGGEIYVRDEKLHHKLSEKERQAVTAEKYQLQTSLNQLEQERNPYNATVGNCTAALLGLGFAYVLGKHVFANEIQQFRENFSFKKQIEKVKRVFSGTAPS